jgi:hypothetical protein
MRLGSKKSALMAIGVLLLVLSTLIGTGMAAQYDQEPGSGGSLQIRIQSADGESYPPGDMVLSDPYAQAMGHDSRYDRDYQEISGATYTQETISGQRNAFLMNVANAVSGTYSLRVIGVNPGRYLLIMDGYDQAGNHANVRFTAQLESGEVHHYVIQYSNRGGASIRARRTPAAE